MSEREREKECWREEEVPDYVSFKYVQRTILTTWIHNQRVKLFARKEVPYFLIQTQYLVFGEGEFKTKKERKINKYKSVNGCSNIHTSIELNSIDESISREINRIDYGWMK